MRIYIAGAYSRRVELLVHSGLLKYDGHEITSRWLTGVYEGREWTDAAIADDDIKDVYVSDCVLSFTEDATSKHKRGGRHVEFGMALAWGKRLVLVGPRENVFHHQSRVEQYSTFEEARNILKHGIKIEETLPS